MENSNSRRSFLRKAALGTIAAVSIPEIVAASVPKKNKNKLELLKDQVILEIFHVPFPLAVV